MARRPPHDGTPTDGTPGASDDARAAHPAGGTTGPAGSGRAGGSVARAHPAAGGSPDATPIDALLDRAVAIPSSAVRKHVASLRRRNPEASPADLVRILEREYSTVLAGAGGAVGVAAAMPAVGTGTGIALTSSDVATFFATSAAFALAVAEVHGIETEDAERRRALLLASVLGAKGAATVAKAAHGSGITWGRALLTSMPTSSLSQVNRALTSKLVRTQISKHAGLALGRLIPFGVGAAVGWAGGRALARTVVGQTRTAFGPPPERFVPVLRVVEVVDPAAPPQLLERVETPPGEAEGGSGPVGRVRGAVGSALLAVGTAGSRAAGSVTGGLRRARRRGSSED